MYADIIHLSIGKLISNIFEEISILNLFMMHSTTEENPVDYFSILLNLIQYNPIHT